MNHLINSTNPYYGIKQSMQNMNANLLAENNKKRNIEKIRWKMFHVNYENKPCVSCHGAR